MAATTKEQLLKVADTKTKQADRLFAQAKNNPGEEWKYGLAKNAYKTAELARESAKKIK